MVRRKVGEAIDRGGRFQWLERIGVPTAQPATRDGRRRGPRRAAHDISSAPAGGRDRRQGARPTDPSLRGPRAEHYQIGLSLWCPTACGGDASPLSAALAFNPTSERIAGMALTPFLGKPFRSVIVAAGNCDQALLTHIAREHSTQVLGSSARATCRTPPAPCRSRGSPSESNASGSRSRTSPPDGVALSSATSSRGNRSLGARRGDPRGRAHGHRTRDPRRAGAVAHRAQDGYRVDS